MGAGMRRPTKESSSAKAKLPMPEKYEPLPMDESQSEGLLETSIDVPFGVDQDAKQKEHKFITTNSLAKLLIMCGIGLILAGCVTMEVYYNVFSKRGNGEVTTIEVSEDINPAADVDSTSAGSVLATTSVPVPGVTSTGDLDANEGVEVADEAQEEEEEEGAVGGVGAEERTTSVYLGNGCFWHTQYDFYEVEKSNVFERDDGDITALVGYAGGMETSTEGKVCYHNGPPGSDYHKLGYTETVQVTLDPTKEEVQFKALLDKFFSHGFAPNPSNGKWGRLDPQDYGSAYRNNIGLPGGVNGELYHVVEEANINEMPLVEGVGEPEDVKGDFVVYIYDSNKFPFYQGERGHQFHANVVVGRPVPEAYLALRDSETMEERMRATLCDHDPDMNGM